MSDWPVGLSTGCFFQQSIFDCLETMGRGGFNIIEICSYPVHLAYHDHDMVMRAARQVEELGMEAYSFHAPFADHIDISSRDSECRRRALTEVLQAAEAAATFQVRYFVIHPGWTVEDIFRTTKSILETRPISATRLLQTKIAREKRSAPSSGASADFTRAAMIESK